MRFYITLLIGCLLLGALTAVGQSPSGVRGCVIFKRPSEAVASIVEYRSYRTYSTNIQVTTSSGEVVRILPRENPVFISYPSVPGAYSGGMKAEIERAVKFYPQMARQLMAIQKNLAAQPPPKTVTKNRPGTPKKVVPKPTVVPPPATPAIDLTTLGGKKYRNVAIQRADPDGLWLLTDTGNEKVLFENLPPELQKRYQYDPVAAAAFSKRARDLAEEKARNVEVALADAEKKKAQAEVAATKRRKLEVAIARRAVHIFGRVLMKNDAGVLIEPKGFDADKLGLPGVPLRDKPTLLMGFPRANDWSSGDLVNEIATPEVGQFSFLDADGVRQSAGKFQWMANPLNDGK